MNSHLWIVTHLMIPAGYVGLPRDIALAAEVEQNQICASGAVPGVPVVP